MPVTINGGAGVTFPDGVQQTNAVTNTGGSPPYYAARAWVNFNGTGTVAIRAAVNVSSITDNGTGDYTVNFTTAMPDANYSVGGAASQSSAPTRGVAFELNPTSPLSTTNCKVRTIVINTSPGVTDAEFVTAIVMR